MLRAVYQGLGYLLPFRLLLGARLLSGREDRLRCGERFGRSSRRRPRGFLLWVHAVSVGEVAALMPLIRHFADSAQILCTTNTLESAEFVRKFAPSSTLHQFICWDSPRFVRRFLAHWRPDLALWAESEIWPNLLFQTSALCPLVLVNGHLSDRSYERWRLFNRLFGRGLFAAFSECLVASDTQAGRFRKLGAVRVANAGNLKYAAAPPPPTRHLPTFKKLLATRKVWVALSTHRGEEEKVLETQKLLKDHLLILVPRHPKRGAEILKMAEKVGLRAALRSRSPVPGPGLAVYIADTLGEVGLWCRLARSVFIGGTWVNLGGHNPLEPLNCGVGSLAFGRDTSRFAELFAELEELGVGHRVDSPRRLARAVESAKGSGAQLLAASLRRRRKRILKTYIGKIESYMGRTNGAKAGFGR